MKTKYLQITEVLETSNNKYVIYITQIEPKNVIYYDEQKTPKQSYHWMGAENWALYYRNMRSIVNNFLSDGVSTEEDAFYLDSKQTVLVNWKASRRSLKSIIPSVIGMDFVGLQVSKVFETQIREVKDRINSTDPLEENSNFDKYPRTRQSRHNKINENPRNLVNPIEKVKVSDERIQKPYKKMKQSTLNIAITRNKTKDQTTSSQSKLFHSNRKGDVKVEDNVVEISDSNSSPERKHKKKVKETGQINLFPLCLRMKNDKTKSLQDQNNEVPYDKSETADAISSTNADTTNVAPSTYIGKSETRREKKGLNKDSGIINETKNRSEEILEEKDGFARTRRSPGKPKSPAEDKHQLKRAWHSAPKLIEEHPPIAKQMKSSDVVDNPKPVITTECIDNPEECNENKTSKSLVALLPVFKIEPLKKVEFISLKDLKPDEILGSFERYTSLLDDLFIKYRGIPQIKGHNGIDHYKVIDLIDNDVQLILMKKLSEKYENREMSSSSKYAKLFAHVMMPEWLLSLYMERLQMNREDALKRLDLQNQYKALTTTLPFESSLGEDSDSNY